MRATAGLFAIVLFARASSATPIDWRIDPALSSLFVDVKKTGALSGLAHDHHFRVERWSGTVSLDPDHPETLSVRIEAQADSLRDQAASLSASDREEVNARAAGPKVLDAGHFPRIRFEARGRRIERAGNVFTATLEGRFELHGTSRDVEVPIRWRLEPGEARGTARFTLKQSDFGIVPYSTALGAIGVQDEVEVSIELVARRSGT